MGLFFRRTPKQDPNFVETPKSGSCMRNCPRLTLTSRFLYRSEALSRCFRWQVLGPCCDGAFPCRLNCCFCKLGVLFVGVLVMRDLQFGVYVIAYDLRHPPKALEALRGFMIQKPTWGYDNIRHMAPILWLIWSSRSWLGI